jgi:hypothetical protein
MQGIISTFTKNGIDYTRELATIDNIHDFYKGSRVDQSILNTVRSKFNTYDPKGIFTSFTSPEDQTVDFFEKTFKTELNTNSHKEITFQDIIDDYDTVNRTGTKLLSELQFCDCLKIEFDDGQSLATTTSDNIKQIGAFIVKFMIRSGDVDKLSDDKLTHFTFDGNSGSLSAILLELKYCINLIIPPNIADSASTTLSHFGPRNYFYFPSTNDEYVYESNILSTTPMKLINKGYNAKKRHFDFDMNGKLASYNDQYRQGPGVSYLASLIGECVDSQPYANEPNLSTVLNINNLLTKNCIQDTTDIFGIKRSGDWEQVLAAKKTESTMSTVLGSIDRLCILFSRMNRQPCILIDLKSEGLTCYRFNNNPNILLRTARTIKDKIDETLPMLDSISTDKSKLITFIDGRIQHLNTAKQVNFNKNVPNADIIKDLIIDKLITELDSIKQTIDANTPEDVANLRDNMLKSLTWLNNLSSVESKMSETVFEAGNFKMSSNDGVDSLEYTLTDTAIANATGPINIVEKCDEIKTKFTNQQDYEKKFKDLDIKIDENGEYLVWGIVDNSKFLRPTAKKPGPKLYDYQLLSDFCKGVLTINSYKEENRRTWILDYSNELDYFFIATRKLLDNLFPEGARETPISKALKKLSIFYSNESITDKKKLNDNYMLPAQSVIKEITTTTPTLLGSVLGQFGGGTKIQCENYIHQINWYVINEMAALEQTLHYIPSVEPTEINDIDKFIFERLEEIFINTESKYLTFLNYCSFLDIEIDSNSDSITVLKTLLFIIKFKYKFNERYEKYKPSSSSFFSSSRSLFGSSIPSRPSFFSSSTSSTSSSDSQNLFPTEYFTEKFDSMLNSNDNNNKKIDEYNIYFSNKAKTIPAEDPSYPKLFLTLNNIFITMTDLELTTNYPINLQRGFYKSDIEEIVSKLKKAEFYQNLIIEINILNQFVEEFIKNNLVISSPPPKLIGVRSTGTNVTNNYSQLSTGVTTQESTSSQNRPLSPPLSPIQENLNGAFSPLNVTSPEVEPSTLTSFTSPVPSPDRKKTDTKQTPPISKESNPQDIGPLDKGGSKKYTIKNKMTKKTSRNSKKHRKTKNKKRKTQKKRRTYRKNK